MARGVRPKETRRPNENLVTAAKVVIGLAPFGVLFARKIGETRPKSLTALVIRSALSFTTDPGDKD